MSTNGGSEPPERSVMPSAVSANVSGNRPSPERPSRVGEFVVLSDAVAQQFGTELHGGEVALTLGHVTDEDGDPWVWVGIGPASYLCKPEWLTPQNDRQAPAFPTQPNYDWTGVFEEDEPDETDPSGQVPS